MSLYDQVRGFVAERSGVAEEALAPETSLLADLKMDSASLESFLAAYAEHFKIDISPFRKAHHFAALRFDPLFPMILMLFKLLSPGTAEKLQRAAPRDISLYHLAACAERKTWAPPAPRYDVPWSAATHTFDLIQALISLGIFVIVLFCVFVGASLVGFAVAQWPRFAMDPVTVLAGPLFLIFGIGYPFWSYRKTKSWIGARLTLIKPVSVEKKASEHEVSKA